MLFDRFKKSKSEPDAKNRTKQMQAADPDEDVTEFEPPAVMEVLPIPIDTMERRKTIEQTYSDLKAKKPALAKHKTGVWL